jgi:hypothetical protein
MDAPHVEGMKVRAMIGSGNCGRVYLAEDEDGSLHAIKIFDGLAIQRALLTRMTTRLENGGWPNGVMPVTAADFDARPALRVMPFLADPDGDSWKPRSLQHRIDSFPGEQSWPLIRELANALAAMHARRVAHGNLKPGNLFFTESGELQIADWTLGNMPGIGHLDFTDALLYQPPEQLKDPAGYSEENGYRWDVFAFGVLSYRLLTSSFPRCHETFSLVAPPQGETRRDGIHADLPRIAKNLENHTQITWPHEPATPLEAGLRSWIDRCLALDPLERPASMLDVVAGFTAVEHTITLELERENLLDQRRHAERRAWRASFLAGAATAAAILLGCLWQLQTAQVKRERANRDKETHLLQTAADNATKLRDTAQKEAAQAKQALDYEREVALSRIEASRLIGDRLFTWAMEKGHRALPPLDGREERLKRLQRYFEDFLTRTAEIKDLDDERARAHLQLAEIALARGDAEAAPKRLTEAIQAWSVLPKDAEWQLRIGQNRLLLALLLQARSDPQAHTAFANARKALSDAPQTGIDTDRLAQLLAILDFHEAKLLASQGNDPKALEQLMRATQTLNRLAEQRPDSIIPRTQLAACYLSSATILEGMGNLGDAREAHLLATGEIIKLLKEKPQNTQLRLDLAGCYGAMAEAAVLSGDITSAESLSAEAMKILLTLVREQPDHAEAVSRLAAQHGLRAGLMRDRGQSEDALKSFDEGIRLLEGIRAAKPTNANATYRLALLWWQKGRMLGFSDKRDEEIALIRQARELLETLETQPRPEGPPDEQLQRSSGYLLGDLGHTYQLAGKTEDAANAFNQAADLWQSLLKSRPQSEEYDESLKWCRQRAKDLK